MTSVGVLTEEGIVTGVPVPEGPAPRATVNEFPDGRLPYETDIYLDPGVRSIWVLAAAGQLLWIVPLMFMFAAIAGAGFGDATFVAVCMFPVIYLAIAVAWFRLSYRCYHFMLMPDAIHVERGVIFKLKAMIPYSRIQNVDIYRGPIMRLFGLGSLALFTAGGMSAASAGPGMGSEAWIQGIPRAMLPPLSEEIMRIALESRDPAGLGGASGTALGPPAGAVASVYLQEETLLELRRIRKLLQEVRQPQ